MLLPFSHRDAAFFVGSLITWCWCNQSTATAVDMRSDKVVSSWVWTVENLGT